MPRKLSHYTNVAGLTGIIDSGCLWASNVSFLNDRSELVHALGAARAAILKISSDAAVSKWSETLNHVVDHLESGELPDTYAVCFCQDDDNLSQWRGYTGGEQGVAMTFDYQLLSRTFRKQKARLHRVTYAKVSTPSRLRDALKGELADMAEIDELLGESSAEQQYDDIFRRVSGLLPKFKHLGFRDEREWRLVVQRAVPEDELCFRTRGDKVVPYIKLSPPTGKLPLVSIRVGPGHDQELTARSLSRFLSAKGYGSVNMRRSDIPFRAD
jgi:hypothetical protein